MCLLWVLRGLFAEKPLTRCLPTFLAHPHHCEELSSEVPTDKVTNSTGLIHRWLMKTRKASSKLPADNVMLWRALMEKWYPVSWRCDVDIRILQCWIEARLCYSGWGLCWNFGFFIFETVLCSPSWLWTHCLAWFFFFKIDFYFMCMSDFFCIYLTALCAYVPVLRKPEETVREPLKL